MAEKKNIPKNIPRLKFREIFFTKSNEKCWKSFVFLQVCQLSLANVLNSSAVVDHSFTNKLARDSKN